MTRVGRGRIWIRLFRPSPILRRERCLGVEQHDLNFRKPLLNDPHQLSTVQVREAAIEKQNLPVSIFQFSQGLGAAQRLMHRPPAAVRVLQHLLAESAARTRNQHSAASSVVSPIVSPINDRQLCHGAHLESPDLEEAGSEQAGSEQARSEPPVSRTVTVSRFSVRSRTLSAPARSNPACATNKPSSGRENSPRGRAACQRMQIRAVAAASPVSTRRALPRAARLRADSSSRNTMVASLRRPALTVRPDPPGFSSLVFSSVMQTFFPAATGSSSSTTSRRRVFNSIVFCSSFVSSPASPTSRIASTRARIRAVSLSPSRKP